jgi:hypothetical protein
MEPPDEPVSGPPPVAPDLTPPPPAYVAYGRQMTAGQPLTTMDHVIPTKNPPALISYYMGIFSIMPILGAALGVVAIVFGVNGVRKLKEEPNLPGKTHAYVGMGCGTLGLLINLVIIGSVVMGIMASAHLR